MKTVQMTLDEELLEELDVLLKKIKMNRSAFAREALRREMKRQEEIELEKIHKLGYEKFPISAEEFLVAEEHSDVPGGEEW